MEDQGRLSQHFWLTQGMARTIGVNLNHALRSGQLGRGEYSELVARCCHCGRAEACMGWMGHQVSGADCPPDWCAVRCSLKALKKPA
ncbi:DUF6455 family protein [Rhodovulum sulfidophilum]|uniref:DUF6455 family protein n=1 Tax=Rhodovulum sulfidophilum TaxID=35806 RepID=UPI000951C7E4|nr:DUF6455 family protein [Rhodovulum sulfidophilum]OLS52367.1 hypothetical protein BV392_10395 [Rhodovulum sulfidophilum]